MRNGRYEAEEVVNQPSICSLCPLRLLCDFAVKENSHNSCNPGIAEVLIGLGSQEMLRTGIED